MLAPELTVLLLALGLEAAIGDPVSRWHPVALFGRGVEGVLRLAPGASPGLQLLFGGLLAAGAVAAVGLGSAAVLGALGGANPFLAMLGGALLLKLSFSYRQLRAETLGLARALEADAVDVARARARALVSRDPSALAPAALASAAIESLAENLCDSVLAPFFYYVLLGAPGALAYRAINTLDAMIGYHGRWEYLGKPAARLDDLVNWAPARLTALVVLAGAWVARGRVRDAWRVALRDHVRTESPNAGWPMAAMAGALGVQLEKTGHYALGDPRQLPTPEHVRRAVRIADAAVALLTIVLLGTAWR